MARLYIENKNVYLQDDRGFILDLENHIEIQKYEKRNGLTLNRVINELIIKHEPMFKAVIEDIEDMVKFFEDSNDNRMGFEFYKYFDLSRYFSIIPILEKYFSIEKDAVKDRELIAELISNITEDLGCYSN